MKHLFWIIFLSLCSSCLNQETNLPDVETEVQEETDSVILKQEVKPESIIKETPAIYCFFHHEESRILPQAIWKLVALTNEEFKIDSVSGPIIKNGVLLPDTLSHSIFYFTGIPFCSESKQRIMVHKESTNSVKIEFMENILYVTENLDSTNQIQTEIFSIDKSNLGYSENIPVQTVWSGDMNCDSKNEIMIRYELDNTIFQSLVGSDDKGVYKILATDSLYWD